MLTVRRLGLGFLAMSLASSAMAIEVEMAQVAQLQKGGKPIGTVELKQTAYGVLITPDLTQLSPGMHGFHLHVGPSCDNFGKAGLGHFDPKKTGRHLGPYNDNGHLGDLPALYVDAKGKARRPILAPRLKLADFDSHTLMIHGGGDNYSDQPNLNGGGGDRIACGVVPIIPEAELSAEPPEQQADVLDIPEQEIIHEEVKKATPPKKLSLLNKLREEASHFNIINNRPKEHPMQYQMAMRNAKGSHKDIIEMPLPEEEQAADVHG